MYVGGAGRYNTYACGDQRLLLGISNYLPLKKKRKELFLIWVNVCFCFHACMCTRCVQYPQRIEGGIGSPESRVMNDCEPSSGCWE